MSWGITKKALNSTVGTPEFKPLDKIIEEWATKDYKLLEIVSMSYEPFLHVTPPKGYYGFSSVDWDVPLGNFRLVHGGSFTPTSNMTSFSVEHFLGDDVSVAYVVATGDVVDSASYTMYLGAINAPMSHYGNNLDGYLFEAQHDTEEEYGAAYLWSDMLPSSKFEFTPDNLTVRTDSYYPFLAGVEYNWFVGVL